MDVLQASDITIDCEISKKAWVRVAPLRKVGGSTYTGGINSDNTGEVHLTLDSSSTLTLTSDTYVTSLNNADPTNANINLNGYKLFINGTELIK